MTFLNRKVWSFCGTHLDRNQLITEVSQFINGSSDNAKPIVQSLAPKSTIEFYSRL